MKAVLARTDVDLPEAEDELLEGPVGEEDAEAVLVEVVAREDLEEVLGDAVQFWAKKVVPRFGELFIMLLLTTSASICLNKSRNLGNTF